MSGNFVLGGTTDSTGTTARIPAKSWTNWDLGREKKMVNKPVHCTRKPAILVSDQFRHKQACALTEEGNKLEILEISIRKFV